MGRFVVATGDGGQRWDVESDCCGNALWSQLVGLQEQGWFRKAIEGDEEFWWVSIDGGVSWQHWVQTFHLDDHMWLTWAVDVCRGCEKHPEPLEPTEGKVPIEWEERQRLIKVIMDKDRELQSVTRQRICVSSEDLGRLGVVLCDGFDDTLTLKLRVCVPHGEAPVARLVSAELGESHGG